MEEPKKVCWRERQEFIDCVFVHSKCVQSGNKKFETCLKEEPVPECQGAFKAFLICREREILDTRQRLR
jgi:hypothetical protein